MIFTEFVTDMACEAADTQALDELTALKNLSLGIVERTLVIKNLEQSKRIGRPIGTYVTYDCPKEIFSSRAGMRTVAGYLSRTLSGMAGRLKKSSPVLVIGLGNSEIIADALGDRAVKGIEVTSEATRETYKQSVCAFSSGVLGTTGVPSAEIAAALSDRLKPSFVILIDSLATSAVSRVGTSFQISTAGITPGSGVGQDKERIDKSVLNAPTIAIGVPLMLSLRTAIYGFIREYAEMSGGSVDEFKLREQLVNKQLSKLVVTPKDIQYMLSYSSGIISDAINMAF